jgi:hypothetical protein
MYVHLKREKNMFLGQANLNSLPLIRLKESGRIWVYLLDELQGDGAGTAWMEQLPIPGCRPRGVR